MLLEDTDEDYKDQSCFYILKIMRKEIYKCIYIKSDQEMCLAINKNGTKLAYNYMI
jgi:hypothetical protein